MKKKLSILRGKSTISLDAKSASAHGLFKKRETLLCEKKLFMKQKKLFAKTVFFINIMIRQNILIMYRQTLKLKNTSLLRMWNSINSYMILLLSWKHLYFTKTLIFANTFNVLRKLWCLFIISVFIRYKAYWKLNIFFTKTKKAFTKINWLSVCRYVPP